MCHTRLPYYHIRGSRHTINGAYGAAASILKFTLEFKKKVCVGETKTFCRTKGRYEAAVSTHRRYLCEMWPLAKTRDVHEEK